MNISISICPASLEYTDGDTYHEGRLLAAIREFIEKKHPGATISCLQIGHRQGDSFAIVDGSHDAGDDLLAEFYEKHGNDEDLFEDREEDVYSIERCRSHEVNNNPQGWESVFSGTGREVALHWRNHYAGPQASGDQYRVVDEDGVEQLIDLQLHCIVGPLY